MNTGINLQKLNKIALERTLRYQCININDVVISAPYFQNFVENYFWELEKSSGVDDQILKKIHTKYEQKEIKFGWGKGKCTPEEIEAFAIEMLKKEKLIARNHQKEGLYLFLTMMGIGIDCSGFVYELLRYSLEKQSLQLNELFGENAWSDKDKKGRMRAGTTFFAKTSRQIEIHELQPLDLILIKEGPVYDHIAIVLNKDGKLLVAQSRIDGVKMNEMHIKNNLPIFKFTQALGREWEERYSVGDLEFRRLNFLS